MDEPTTSETTPLKAEENDKNEEGHREGDKKADTPLSTDACPMHNDDKVERRLMARIDAQSEMHPEEEHEDHTNGQNAKKVALMMSITFCFFLVELVVGFLNRSIALLADSYHMLSDVMALGVAFICLQISQRKSKKNGFGWVRAEVLGALVNGVFLLAMCFTISLESFGRLLHPRKMTHPLQVLIVGTIGLFINLVGIGLFHGGHGHSHGGGGGHGHSHGGAKSKTTDKSNHGHSHDGHGHSHDNKDKDELEVRQIRSHSRLSNDCSHNHLALRLVNLDPTSDDDFDGDDDSSKKRNRKIQEAENLNMRGVLLHIISDAIGSIFVIVTAALAYLASDKMGPVLDYLDPALSLCLVLLICVSAYRLVSETAAIILGKPPSFIDYDDMKKDVLKIKGVAEVTELHTWTLVANRHIATAQIVFCSVAAFDKAAPKIRKLFHGIGIHSLTIQPSFSQTTCSASTNQAKLAKPEVIGEEDSVELQAISPRDPLLERPNSALN